MFLIDLPLFPVPNPWPWHPALVFFSISVTVSDRLSWHPFLGVLPLFLSLVPAWTPVLVIKHYLWLLSLSPVSGRLPWPPVLDVLSLSRLCSLALTSCPWCSLLFSAPGPELLSLSLNTILSPVSGLLHWPPFLGDLFLSLTGSPVLNSCTCC